MPKSWTIEWILPPVPLFLPNGVSQVINTLSRNTVLLALQDAAGYISEEANRFADTGALAQSIGSYPHTIDGGIELTGADTSAEGLTGRVFSALPYAIVMEEGRRSGQPISRAGIDAIGLWAQRKLGLSADEASSVKYAIATQIVRRGIEGKHFFETGVQRSKGRRDQLFKILGDQIGQALTSQGGTGAVGV